MVGRLYGDSLTIGFYELLYFEAVVVRSLKLLDFDELSPSVAMR